uniref:DUF243 domain-containing protein n=1 Tax=Glossina morsitans morsitans TaxID=37546 RepID=A0A1B0GBT5_GLOMM
MDTIYSMIMLIGVAVFTVSSKPQGYNYQSDDQFLTSNVKRSASTQLTRRIDDIHNSPVFSAASHYLPPPAQAGQSFDAQEQYHTLGNQPTITKDIYLHFAPEYPHEEKLHSDSTVPRKHYRIIFIKSPVTSLSEVAARFRDAVKQEKTIIYVLNRKHDPIEIQSAIEEAVNKEFTKPEVFFIKYNTPEEAERAQHAIQAEYEKLGGTTRISDKSVAPVVNVLDDQSVSTIKSSDRR